MALQRRRLRVFATTWLVFQVAWLTALAPAGLLYRASASGEELP